MWPCRSFCGNNIVIKEKFAIKSSVFCKLRAYNNHIIYGYYKFNLILRFWINDKRLILNISLCIIDCSFSLLAQRKRTGSEAAKEKAARSYWSARGGLPSFLKE